jgi:hypothetical protein
MPVIRALALFAVILFVTLTPAAATTITITDGATDLPETARETISILMDAGLPVRRIGDHRFVIEVHGFHCDLRSRGAYDPDDPRAGVPTRRCRVGAENGQDTRTGKTFGEGRALLGILEGIAKQKGLQFADCAMGYCGAYAANIRCTINTTVESFDKGGRWACAYTDEQ